MMEKLWHHIGNAIVAGSAGAACGHLAMATDGMTALYFGWAGCGYVTIYHFVRAFQEAAKARKRTPTLRG